jgi:predicted membrane-bound mannosyltransferase
VNWVKERIGPLEGEITWERNEGFVLTAGLLVLLGSFLRLRQYFINRSLWLDEAALALNLVQKSFVELASPLDYDQGAPIGFLWVQKVIITFLGAEELSLRIFPLICGLLSLLLFGWIASAFLDKRDMLIALALFAIAGPIQQDIPAIMWHIRFPML